MSPIHAVTVSSNPYMAFAKSNDAKTAVQSALPVQAARPVQSAPSSAPPVRSGSTVTISQAARDALAAATDNKADVVDKALAQIKAKNPVNRTTQEAFYLQTRDPQLAEVLASKQSPLVAGTGAAAGTAR